MFNYLGVIKIETETCAFINDLGSKEGFDISFSIEYKANENANGGNISIYNLSETTISSFEVGQAIRLTAGYRDFNGIIFEGQIINIDRERTGEGDLILNLEVDDYSFNFSKYQVAKNYAPNTSAKTIIEDIISTIGYPINAIELPVDKNYINGFTVKNSARKILQDIATDCSSKVVFEGNGISVIPIRKSFRGSFELSADNGLVGTLQKLEKEIPYEDRVIEKNDQLLGRDNSTVNNNSVSGVSGNVEGSITKVLEEKRERRKIKYIKCTMFLKHDVKLGDNVRLNSLDTQGSYNVTYIRHYADNKQSQLTELELELEA